MSIQDKVNMHTELLAKIGLKYTLPSKKHLFIQAYFPTFWDFHYACREFIDYLDSFIDDLFEVIKEIRNEKRK